MRRVFGVWACMSLVVFADDAVTVEVTVEPSNPYVHQSVLIEVRVSADPSRLVQLFSQKLDVPIQLQAMWLKADVGQTLVLNDSAVEAASVTSGIYVLRQRVVPKEPGALALDVIRLRYATAKSFREDFLRGRVPVGRVDEERLISVPPISVRALPDAPASFHGAIGVFTISAESDMREVDVDQPFFLTITIRGSANVDQFDTPRLDALRGFHVYGALDDRASDLRTIRYELAVTDAKRNVIPAIEFTSFDPETGQYRVVATKPIELSVRATKPAEEDASIWPAIWVALIGGTIGVCAGLIRRRSRARQQVAFGAATRAFHERQGADALAIYLALRLDCEPASIIAPDLARRLREFGLPDELAQRSADAMQATVAADYGGERAAGENTALVAELDRAFANLLV